MAKTPQKEVASMSKAAVLDQLQQVNELNKEFLVLLQSRVRQQRACLGLPTGARAVLAVSTGAVIDSVAGFPCALFNLELGPCPRPEPAKTGVDFDEAEHELCLSALLEARTASRHSVHKARVLFGLDRTAIERLCAASLPDLRRLACAPGALLCAFRERSWLWQELLTTTRPELRRQLTLMALQPRIAVDWPLRRPPQASA
jgi:hypothetical protein